MKVFEFWAKSDLEFFQSQPPAVVDQDKKQILFCSRMHFFVDIAT